ncbi:MAG: hypothetical protein GX992_02140 [Clostridium sp.]|nr:hypothetical protein [Clostridium sp.]
MLGLFKSKKRINKLDEKILRKNNISILLLDERWNAIFRNIEKTEDIKAAETKLKELLKEEARLISERKGMLAKKKENLDRIIHLTPEAYDKNSEPAREEMKRLKTKTKDINRRLENTKIQIENMPSKIREANIKLLECTINSVYFRMRKNRKRLEELEELIETTKNQLGEYIDERERLSGDDTDIYAYFHDLLGGEELEKLDMMHFKT